MLETVNKSKQHHGSATSRKGLGEGPIKRPTAKETGEMLAQIGNVFTDIYNGRHTKAIVNLLSLMGPYGALIANIFQLSYNGEFNAIMKKLDEIDKKLDQILLKLDKVIEEIKLFEKEQQINKAKVSVAHLASKFELYAANPENEEIKALFSTVCLQEVPEGHLFTLYFEMTDQGAGFLKPVLLERLDLPLYEKISLNVITISYGCTMLNMACLYANSKNTTDSTELLRLDGDQMTLMLEGMSDSVGKGRQFIIDNFWTQVVKDVRYVMEDNRGLTKEKYAGILYDFLKQKFYWRVWFVVNWSASTSGPASHWWVCGNKNKCIEYTRDFGRTSMYATPQNKGPTRKKYFECLDSFRNRHLRADEFENEVCKVFTEHILKCLGGEYTYIGCVVYGNGLRAKADFDSEEIAFDSIGGVYVSLQNTRLSYYIFKHLNYIEGDSTNVRILTWMTVMWVR